MIAGWLLSFALYCSGGGNQDIQLDEIYLAKFVSSYQVSDRVLVMGFSKVKASFYLYHFTTGRIRLIEDSRIQAFFPYLAGDEHGFRIFTVLGDPRVYFLDREGSYLHHVNLTDFQGWKPHRIAFLQPLSGTHYLATLDTRGRGLIVATIDLDKATIQHEFALPAHEEFGQWCVTVANHYYLVTLQTGEIRQIDPGRMGRTMRIVQPGIEPVEKKKFRTPYRQVFSRPTYVNGDLHFKYRSLRDRFGNESLDPKMCSLSFTEAGARMLDTVVLARYQGFSLIWDESSGELALR